MCGNEKENSFSFVRELKAIAMSGTSEAGSREISGRNLLVTNSRHLHTLENTLIL